MLPMSVAFSLKVNHFTHSLTRARFAMSSIIANDSADSATIDQDAHDKEANSKSSTHFIFTWPVDKNYATLSVDPSVILRANQLAIVSWHDVLPRRWHLLTADEQTNLKKDIWYYSRTGLREDAVRAATALVDEISEKRAAFT